MTTDSDDTLGEEYKRLSKHVDEKIEIYKRAVEAEYEAKIRELTTDRKSFDDLVRAATWVGGIASALLFLFSFFVGKSITDIQSTAKIAAQNAFEDAIREKTKEGNNLSELMTKAQTVSASLEDMKKSLKGYVDLLGATKTASDFDPLVGYYSIEAEIDRRYDNTRKFNSGSKSIKPSDTIKDPEFRQKSALIFEKLVSSVREDKKTGYIRFQPDVLFNIAADASKLDMDFVALEIMEAAYQIDKNVSPEIEARLTRHRLVFRRISPDEAVSEIKRILSKSSSRNMHHVVSEAFNIGLIISDPVRLESIIMSSLPNPLSSTSYVKLVSSRLLFMGAKKEDWEKAGEIYCSGLSALRDEPNSARWLEHSIEEVEKITRQIPEMEQRCKAPDRQTTL